MDRLHQQCIKLLQTDDGERNTGFAHLKNAKEITSRMYKYGFGLIVVNVTQALEMKKYDMNLKHS